MLSYGLRIVGMSILYRWDNIVQRDYLVLIACFLLYRFLAGLKTGSYSGSFDLYFFFGVSIALAQQCRRQLYEDTLCYCEPEDLQNGLIYE